MYLLLKESKVICRGDRYQQGKDVDQGKGEGGPLGRRQQGLNPREVTKGIGNKGRDR